jgi:hypothetical protein
MIGAGGDESVKISINYAPPCGQPLQGGPGWHVSLKIEFGLCALFYATMAGVRATDY